MKRGKAETRKRGNEERRLPVHCQADPFGLSEVWPPRIVDDPGVAPGEVRIVTRVQEVVIEIEWEDGDGGPE